jgi:hypothetical protein
MTVHMPIGVTFSVVFLKCTIFHWRSYPGIMGLPMFETAQLPRQLGMNCYRLDSYLRIIGMG